MKLIPWIRNYYNRKVCQKREMGKGHKFKSTRDRELTQFLSPPLAPSFYGSFDIFLHCLGSQGLYMHNTLWSLEYFFIFSHLQVYWLRVVCHLKINSHLLWVKGFGFVFDIKHVTTHIDYLNNCYNFKETFEIFDWV